MHCAGRDSRRAMDISQLSQVDTGNYPKVTKRCVVRHYHGSLKWNVTALSLGVTLGLVAFLLLRIKCPRPTVKGEEVYSGSQL